MRRGNLIMAALAVALVACGVGLSHVEASVDTREARTLSAPVAPDLGPAPKAADNSLVTHLPIVSVDTNGVEIPLIDLSENQEDVLPAGVRVDPACTLSVIEGEGWNCSTDSPSTQARGTIRIRGNSSRHFDKKSYLVRFTASGDAAGRESLLGMPAASEWVLHGPYLDRTLVRNALCYAVAGQVMPYAPRTRYCELIINGEYQGVYLLTEAITREEGRVSLTARTNNNPITGWLVRLDRKGKGDTPLDVFSVYTYRTGISGMDLRYPGHEKASEDSLAYVTEQVSTIERELYATGHCAELDLTAFAQYFVLNEFFGNVDAGRFSTYLYKDVRGKVTPVVWDFNNACDNYIDYEYDDSGFYLTDAPWYSALLSDEAFVSEVIAQYRALRKGALSNAQLTAYVDGAVAYLGDAVGRNYARWQVFDLANVGFGSNYDVNYLHPLSRNYTSYDEAVAQLKDWLCERGEWLDEHIDALRQHCHPSKDN